MSGFPITRVRVSPQWTPEDRSAVRRLIRRRFTSLQDERHQMRQIRASSDPYVKENWEKMAQLKALLDALRISTSAELEANRFDFQEFIEK